MKTTQSVLILKGPESQFDDLLESINQVCEQVSVVSSTDSAVVHLSKKSPPLILMDLIFDGKEAIDFIEYAHQMGVTRRSLIIIFSSRQENYVQIAALNAGAADFMVKPVNKRVFSSRLKSWLRQQALVQDNGASDFENPNAVILDEEKYVAIVNRKNIELQRREFEIMALLVSKPRKVFSREEIIDKVWTQNTNVNARTIDVHIRNLRTKLGPNQIKTFKGVGYSYQVV